MPYDPRRALIPIDPSSVEAAGPGGEVVPTVPGVPLIGRPGGRARGFFGKLGRGIMEGEYAFEPAPATLPFKPKTATNLLYLAQGILQGLSQTRHAKEAAAERASIQEARKAGIAGEAENRKLRAREIDVAEGKVKADLAREDRERDDKLRSIAEKVATNSAGAVRYSQVYQALKSGNEQVLDAAVDAYSTMQGLGPAGQAFYASRIAQHRLGKGEPTPDDLARMAGEAADFVQKGIKNEETRANVDLGIAREKLKEAQALAKAGYLSPGQASQNGQAWLAHGTSLIQTASVEQRALINLLVRNRAGDLAQQFMEGDDAAKADILTSLSTSPNKTLAAGAKRVKELQDLGFGLMRYGTEALAFAEGRHAPTLTEPSVPDLSAGEPPASGSPQAGAATPTAGAPQAAAPPPKPTVAARVRAYVAAGMTQEQAIEKVAAEGE